MLSTAKAVVKEGKVQFLEDVEIPEGTELLVTILSEDSKFWFRASEASLNAVWDNKEDDVYEQLLKK